MGANGSAEGAIVRSELAPGTELVKIKASYVGSLPLATMNKAPNFILNAARKIAESKAENVPVQMQITDTGVFVTHASSNALLAEVALADISNVTQVSANRVAYLRRDRKTGFLACHLFYFPKHATRVIEVLNQACAANVSSNLYSSSLCAWARPSASVEGLKQSLESGGVLFFLQTLSVMCASLFGLAPL